MKGKAKIEEEEDKPVGRINMIASGVESGRDERERRKQTRGEVKIMAVEMLS